MKIAGKNEAQFLAVCAALCSVAWSNRLTRGPFSYLGFGSETVLIVATVIPQSGIPTMMENRVRGMGKNSFLRVQLAQ